jgi:predicted transport protein
MPQNERLRADWRNMLGAEWKEIQKTWLHRLGNLTLTGYNSKYSDRAFAEKKTIEGGFADSSVRLNKYVREQPVWTAKEIEHRIEALARRAVDVWPTLVVAKSLIDAADQAEIKKLAAQRDVSKVKMSGEAKSLFDVLRTQVLAIDSDILELAERNSVSYHGPAFFLEVLPRRYTLNLLMPLDFNEIDDPSGLAQDATQWKFFIHAKHDGGVSLSIEDIDTIAKAVPLIRQAHAVSRE